MARVTVEEVKAIISTKLGEQVIEQYINSAGVIMDMLKGHSLPAPLMKEIERWITAHLIASSRERQAREEGAGGAYVRYAGMSYSGLRSTTYGQHAIALDTSGVLATMAGKTVTFKVIKEQ